MREAIDMDLRGVARKRQIESLLLTDQVGIDAFYDCSTINIMAEREIRDGPF